MAVARNEIKLPAFKLGKVTERIVEEALDAAPEFRSRFNILQHLHRTLHAIPDLFHQASLSELELCFGGSSRSNVLGWLREHHRTKRYDYGLIVFRTTGMVFRRFERATSSLIADFRKANLLCSHDMCMDMSGYTKGQGVVCVTWRFHELPPRRRILKQNRKARLYWSRYC